MKKFFLVIFCVLLAFNTNAQIDLGVDEVSSGESLSTGSADSSSSNDLGSGAFSFLSKAFNIFGSSQSVSTLPSGSLDELKKKADGGDVASQLDLGYMFLYGTNGATVNYQQAFHYYNLAAESKNPIALNNLGSLYFNGIGTNVDYAKAIDYFRKAAEYGSDDAAVNLAVIFLSSNKKINSPEIYREIRDLLEKSATKNDIAKYLLGYSYYVGFDVRKDYKKAFNYIKSVADKAEYDEAQLVLSEFYINGHGTPKNYTRAVQYLESASEQGNGEAMVRLGDIYSSGKIYKQDILQAHYYYNIASFMGRDDAAEKRDMLEKSIKIEDLLSIQSEAEDYKQMPSEKTTFVRKTYGNSLKVYIDVNMK